MQMSARESGNGAPFRIKLRTIILLKLHYNFGPLPLQVSPLPSYVRATSWPISRNSHEDHIPKDTLLFLFPIGIELLKKREEVVGLLLVLQAGINHFRTRYFRFRVLDVVAEGGLVPGDPRVLVGGRV